MSEPLAALASQSSSTRVRVWATLSSTGCRDGPRRSPGTTAISSGNCTIPVADGGIAGLEAAWVAVARGHKVTVLGAGAQVGGSTRLHAGLPGGESLSSIYDHQWEAARRAGVRFELGLLAGPDDVLTTRPDAVVFATGASMLWPLRLPASWRDDRLIPDLRAAMRALSSHRERQDGTALIFDMDHTAGTSA